MELHTIEPIAKIHRYVNDPVKAVEYLGVIKDFEPIKDRRWKEIFNLYKEESMVISFPHCGFKFTQSDDGTFQTVLITHEDVEGFYYLSEGAKKMCHKTHKIVKGRDIGINYWMYADEDGNPIGTTYMDDMLLRTIIIISAKTLDLGIGGTGFEKLYSEDSWMNHLDREDEK